MKPNKASTDMIDERKVKPALIRGWKRVCPNCGSGPILKDYLTVHKNCAVCSEELHYHGTNDGPAYVTILICAHILAPLIMMSFVTFHPDPTILFLAFSLFFVALALFLLPRIKGAFIGLQWAKHVTGFGNNSITTPAE